MCKLDMSGWITVDTILGDGSGVPVTELIRGRLTPAKEYKLLSRYLEDMYIEFDF